MVFSLLPEVRGGESALVVVAGSASKPVLEEAVSVFEGLEGASVTLMLGGSGELLSKVRLTGTGDVYLPGSHDFMEIARSHGLIATGTEVDIAFLVPAICVPTGNPAGINRLEDLASPGVRVGIGHPETVCVGLYAVEILEKAGLSEKVRANLTTYFESCAKVANSVSLGSVDAVLGWREFGSWAPDKIRVIQLPPDSIPRVATLPGGVLTCSQNRALGEKFLRFLVSPEGRTIYRKWGYLASEDEIRKPAPKAQIGGLYLLPEGWK